MQEATPSWGVEPVPERLRVGELLGSFLVPLFGVLVADRLSERAHSRPENVFNDAEWRFGAIVAWLAGFGLYQWLSRFNASLPSFASAFALTLLFKSVTSVARRRRTALA